MTITINSLVVIVSFGASILLDPNYKMNTITVFISMNVYEIMKFILVMGPAVLTAPYRVQKSIL